MKSKNPNFSLRAFARRLGIQPSPLGEILKGRRRVSKSMAEKFAAKLMLDPTESMYLLKDFPAVLARNSVYREKSSQELQLMRLNSEQFALIADWVHFAILNLSTTKNFISDEEWIAERLGVDLGKVEECLKRLFELQLIKRDEAGTLVRTATSINSSDDVRNISLQKAHLADMEMAREKLTECDVKMRDFTSITIPFDEELMPEVKEMIRRFQTEIYEFMRTHEPRQVYKMNTYLYPLTKLTPQENRNEHTQLPH